ncbi:50S ribosomal protein L35 [Helicobacter saguini]|uniref:Large ribosomal subunit protein bL35 n=1 Tax=Helicobacter saguini TaxID=1548018 RepID=A0A347VTB0_9HELI|nr:50S ribosomal protein L35 [Helicobacter saguini]MWV62172.1 50S ribosomal protein L35 [Helicobacter saguini]MWV67155.1 50S ribosomal protein L35 [Helicobacter saguini]MWV69507.1 50S ribosomal protein L35 [Helicobacter saguini]MWV70942.1 50S ribosomal protein L35 [Helicobacter saguini]TLD92524.1 50S ribosomal protein L35 [Helicobacter saguini]
MPKMKTNRGAAKRFKLKANAVKRGSAFKSHILTKKSPKRKARLNSPHYVHESNLDAIRILMCRG